MKKRAIFLSSNGNAGRILVFIAVILAGPSSAIAGPLEIEAASLRSKCLANSARLDSLALSTAISLEALTGGGSPSGPVRQGRERAVWSRTKAKLKFSKLEGAPLAYVADVSARTVTTSLAAGSTYTESVPAGEAEALGTPFPGWLWRPGGIIPSAPAAVRAEPGVLVLVTAMVAPAREVRLDRSSGCLLGFTETDVTGRVIRTVIITGWVKRDGVWMPGSVDDRIQGTESGLHRVVRFETSTVNPTLTDADFKLP
jgi:hypothetical protein